MYDMMTVTQMRREALQQEAEARRLVELARSDSQQPRRTIGRIIQTLLVTLR